jgi:hypothetical protein
MNTPEGPAHELTDEELLPLMVASERRNRQRRRGHTRLLYPDPPCAVCGATPQKQWVRPVDPDPLGLDLRLVVNDPCGHRMTYTLAAAERLVHQVRHVVDQEEDRTVQTAEPEGREVCTPFQVDGETVRVRGSGELTEESKEALADVVRVAKAQLEASEVPEEVAVLEKRLRLAHQARRAKEHQLNGIRRALCDAGFMEDDDPYGHADLEDVIRQVGQLVGPLLAEVAAARKFAGEMRDFCSPHGVAVDYADRLVEAMDRAKEGGR